MTDTDDRGSGELARTQEAAANLAALRKILDLAGIYLMETDRNLAARDGEADRPFSLPHD